MKDVFVTYYDESGDDGLPGSSPYFVLTAVSVPASDWTQIYKALHAFRMELKEKYKIPVKLEFHTKHFVLNKWPYRNYNFSDEIRTKVVEEYCDCIKALKLLITNVAINKTIVKKTDYPVLQTAFTYSIQRIENTLKSADNRFMMVTDYGRVGKMTRVSRCVQRINYIPSKFDSGTYNKEIKLLIEDPLPKKSGESYFIQIADLISYLTHIYLMQKHGKPVSRRLPAMLNAEQLLERIKNILNLKATADDKFGVVCYPKK